MGHDFKFGYRELAVFLAFGYFQVCALPTVSGKHQDLKYVNPETVSRLLEMVTGYISCHLVCSVPKIPTCICISFTLFTHVGSVFS